MFETNDINTIIFALSFTGINEFDRKVSSLNQTIYMFLIMNLNLNGLLVTRQIDNTSPGWGRRQGN